MVLLVMTNLVMVIVIIRTPTPKQTETPVVLTPTSPTDPVLANRSPQQGRRQQRGSSRNGNPNNRNPNTGNRSRDTPHPRDPSNPWRRSNPWDRRDCRRTGNSFRSSNRHPMGTPPTVTEIHLPTPWHPPAPTHTSPARMTPPQVCSHQTPRAFEFIDNVPHPLHRQEGSIPAPDPVPPPYVAPPRQVRPVWESPTMLTDTEPEDNAPQQLSAPPSSSPSPTATRCSTTRTTGSGSTDPVTRDQQHVCVSHHAASNLEPSACWVWPLRQW